MIGQSILCNICGSTEIKETHRNKYGRKMRYQSNFGRKEYCSRECFFIGVWKRQMRAGIFLMIFSIIVSGFLIYIELQWGADGMIDAISIYIPLVGVAIGAYIMYTGIKGKRLKEEREFRSYNGSE